MRLHNIIVVCYIMSQPTFRNIVDDCYVHDRLYCFQGFKEFIEKDTTYKVTVEDVESDGEKKLSFCCDLHGAQVSKIIGLFDHGDKIQTPQDLHKDMQTLSTLVKDLLDHCDDVKADMKQRLVKLFRAKMYIE